MPGSRHLLVPLLMSQKAIEAYDYALVIDPSYTNALFAKGNTYYVDGDYENASKCFIETVNDPNMSRYLIIF